ncbi:hypothetical protein [Sphingobium cupriresistens]|uniref:L,D-transpeptidase n=1 Tax=Sphingobium cupriresistens TaxID=1132417 RepID=A0A8G1ZHN5_9SPHN|nr:hypothetical protein [Sphingobium cupriresistens]RYM12940.1 hypothetical protein EWH12_06395 [Sphingobium cupriresistens]
MNFTMLLAIAGLGLAVTGPVEAAGPGKVAAQAPATDAPVILSDGATRVAEWVAAAQDNHALPYIIIDKPGAAAYLFDAKGKMLAHAPVLIGIAPGDDATPGIGTKNLSEIGPAEKTTPAGRFLAKFGVAAGKQRVLWVDYATSVALHTIPPGNLKDKRKERMLSPAIDDNRITFGCINVPKIFYNQSVSPRFRKKGGYVYILPDSKPLEDVFPRLRVQPFLNAAAGSTDAVAGQ